MSKVTDIVNQLNMQEYLAEDMLDKLCKDIHEIIKESKPKASIDKMITIQALLNPSLFLLRPEEVRKMIIPFLVLGYIWGIEVGKSVIVEETLFKMDRAE